jgi:hypothetical protein
MREPIDPKDKRAIEKEIGRSLSEFIIRVLCHIDGDYSLSELQELCGQKGLVVSGNKKPLAFRLLMQEVSIIK